MSHHSSSTQSTPPTTVDAKGHTKPALIVAGVLLAICFGYWIYWTFFAQYHETTEDAYVEGNVVQVTPQTTGTVTAIHADNTDYVSAGTVLLSLNPIDAKLALQRNEAQLAKTVRQVRGQFSSASQMQANIDLRRADLSRARADLERRKPLVKTGAISNEEFRHAEETVRLAEAALNSTEQQFVGNQALVEKTSIVNHPDVVIAAMQVRDAYLSASRSELRAPVMGMVTKRNVQVGQRVNPGAPLMSIVPLDQLWVTANFKESQLKNIRIGQSVTLTADVYGHAVEYNGKVIGLDAGTGSAFSLMPAQNATGNWIKVIQRVPVRIALDEKQIREYPLRLGLSMKVQVDTTERQGLPMAIAQELKLQSYESNIYADEQKGAEDLISHIILANVAANTSKAENTKP